MNIDSHQHFWRYDAQRDTWITEEMSILKRDFLPEDLLPELSANGIEGTIAVQADQSERETHFLLDCAARHAEIVGVVGWVDLRAPNLPERLAFFAQFEKLRGFRHVVQDEADDRFLLHEDFCRGIARLCEFGFTYDILIYPQQLPAACAFVEKFPGQRFVIDHLGKPAVRAKDFNAWSKHLRAAAAHPHVFCKLSGLITEADWGHWRPEDCKPCLDVAFEAFGAGRLMFGSDWPVCLLAGSYAQVKDLIADYAGHFPAAEREKIFGLNAARFYGLRASQHGLAAER
jgi:L-fuconolactonase